jgi:hypothetical protein
MSIRTIAHTLVTFTATSATLAAITLPANADISATLNNHCGSPTAYRPQAML